jgi:hypothetical protein
MPSEDRSAQALAALARPREAFESALTDAVAELRALIAEQRAPRDLRAAQESARLGAFAAGSFDAARFSALVAAPQAMDAARVDRLEQALAVLTLFAAQGDELFHVRVQRGEDLRDTVRGALAARGRVFNAAHQVELLRSGRNAPQPATYRQVDGPVAYRQWSLAPSESSGLLTFRDWSRVEKSIAPPLLVEVSGADVQVGGLAEYLEGAQKIVLVVDGPAAPAPLARLITPDTFVMQTTDPAAVRGLADFDGPGIAAVLPDGCARFVHDPTRGRSLARRLVVEFMPDAPARRVAGSSARRQAEELAWLAELTSLAAAAAAVEPAAAVDTDAAAAPADQLAGWLLALATEDA